MYISVLEANWLWHCFFPCNDFNSLLFILKKFDGQVVDVGIVYSDELEYCRKHSPERSLPVTLSERLIPHEECMIAQTRKRRQSMLRPRHSSPLDYYIGRCIYKYVPDDRSNDIFVEIVSARRACDEHDAYYAFVEDGQLLSDINYFSVDFGKVGRTEFAGVAFVGKVTECKLARLFFCQEALSDEARLTHCVLSRSELKNVVYSLLCVNENRKKAKVSFIE